MAYKGSNIIDEIPKTSIKYNIISFFKLSFLIDFQCQYICLVNKSQGCDLSFRIKGLNLQNIVWLWDSHDYQNVLMRVKDQEICKANFGTPSCGCSHFFIQTSFVKRRCTFIEIFNSQMPGRFRVYWLNEPGERFMQLGSICELDFDRALLTQLDSPRRFLVSHRGGVFLSP